MIIVDSPPVLPVADALMIGRWTDGVVLAVRSDTSRFPLIERATRRLVHVGVPLIGAVVNGVPSTASSYGGYYAYGATTYPDGTSLAWSSTCVSCCPKTAPGEDIKQRSSCPGFGGLMISRFQTEFFVARGTATTTHGNGVCDLSRRN